MTQKPDSAHRDAAVAAQYEQYPYPARDPREEARRLIVGSPSNLPEMDHIVFDGALRARAQRAASPVRVLVAGGGTGDATVMMAQQFSDAGLPVEITYLDMSEAARKITEARVSARDLKTVRFVTGSLLDVQTLAPGPYDYIDCCGVLHHLEDPLSGLRALRTVLADDGGMGLMVYGALGRTGVYHFQEMMRLLGGEAAGTETPNARMQTGRKLYRTLPPSNWLRLNPVITDLSKVADADFYDTVLHTRDRAYTVPELCVWLNDSGLDIAAFALPVRYMPETYLNDPALKRQAEGLGREQKWAMAELLSGAIKAHAFYAVPKERVTVGQPLVPTLQHVPVLTGVGGAEMAKGLAKSATVKTRIDGVEVSFPLPRPALRILAQIDNSRTLEVVLDVLRGEDASWDGDKLLKMFQPLYEGLHALGQLFLRSDIR